jgi:hypothetical protein
LTSYGCVSRLTRAVAKGLWPPSPSPGDLCIPCGEDYERCTLWFYTSQPSTDPAGRNRAPHLRQKRIFTASDRVIKLPGRAAPIVCVTSNPFALVLPLGYAAPPLLPGLRSRSGTRLQTGTVTRLKTLRAAPDRTNGGSLLKQGGLE